MRRDRGAALLLVVLLVTLLTVVVVEFFREAGFELRAAENLRDSLQGHATARSGTAVAAALLPVALGQPKLVQFLFEEGVLPLPIPVPGGSVEVGFEFLDGMFPLGALVNQNGERVDKVYSAYVRLLKGLALEDVDTDQLADALVDWMDKDDRGSYEQSDRYDVPNAPLENLEDLSRIEGYAKIWGRLLPYVDTRREANLNYNTAPPKVLLSIHPGMDDDRAESLRASLNEKTLEKGQAGTLRTRSGVSDLDGKEFVFASATESNRVRVIIGFTKEGSLETSHRSMAVLVREGSKPQLSIAEWHERWDYPARKATP
jgi:general secretion pathway protein K